MDSLLEHELLARRQEAGDFLRSRRERLNPSDVGLPNGFRRRTPGLRREEVAMLAGAGTAWYTWLEQGRDVSPSNELLSALANALRLDPAERRHLFLLFDRAAPDPQPDLPEKVDESVRRTLDNLVMQPAFVLGRRWDILAWNRAAEVVYSPFDRLIGDARNMLYLVFADAHHRALLVDWEDFARASVAMFQADYGRYAGDRDFARLVNQLTRASTEFAHWWSQRAVVRQLNGKKLINHPTAGLMVFGYSSFGINEIADAKLIILTSLEELGTKQKMRDLLKPDSISF